MKNNEKLLRQIIENQEELLREKDKVKELLTFSWTDIILNILYIIFFCIIGIFILFFVFNFVWSLGVK